MFFIGFPLRVFVSVTTKRMVRGRTDSTPNPLFAGLVDDSDEDFDDVLAPSPEMGGFDDKDLSSLSSDDDLPPAATSKANDTGFVTPKPKNATQGKKKRSNRGRKERGGKAGGKGGSKGGNSSDPPVSGGKVRDPLKEAEIDAKIAAVKAKNKDAQARAKLVREDAAAALAAEADAATPVAMNPYAKEWTPGGSAKEWGRTSRGGERGGGKAPSWVAFVGNLSYSVDEAALRELCTPFGSVASVRIGTDRETGQHRGFAHVEFREEAGLMSCVRALDKTEVHGRPIRIEVAGAKGGHGGETRRGDRKKGSRGNKGTEAPEAATEYETEDEKKQREIRERNDRARIERKMKASQAREWDADKVYEEEEV